MQTLHEAQENMRKLVEQDQRNAEVRRVYERHLLNEAAPALLDACELANYHLSRFMQEDVSLEEYPVVMRLRMAIAKARGESVSLATSEGKSE